MAAPELLTPRLRLRAPLPGDVERLSALSSDGLVARMTTRIPQPNPPRSLRDALSAMASQGELVRVIDDGQAQGMCGIGPRGIGYWVGAPVRGRGYAAEAAAALLAHAFGDMGLREAPAGVFVDNPASLRVLTRLGFRRTGRSRAMSVGRGREVDQIDLALPRAAWLAGARFRLVTPRLALQPMCGFDATSLAALSDPLVARMTLSVRHPLTPAEAARRIEASAFRGRPGFRVGIFRDGRLVGEAGLAPLPSDGSAPEISVWIGPDHRGQGLAREALSAFLPHVFARFGLAKLAAQAFEDNDAARALLIRLGFVETGRAMGAAPGRVGRRPAVRCTLSSAAFEAALTRAPATGRSAA